MCVCVCVCLVLWPCECTCMCGCEFVCVYVGVSMWLFSKIYHVGKLAQKNKICSIIVISVFIPVPMNDIALLGW